VALSSYPFDGQSTTESQYTQLFRELQDSGVVPTTTNAWQVSADASGMVVSLQPGFALVRGHAISSTAVETLTIAAAGTTNRTDVIVLRLDPALNTIVPAVVKGAADGSEPALTQTDTDIYEHRLAKITVRANATNVGVNDVTDARRYVGSRVRNWTTATRPTTPRLAQLGLNTDANTWEYWNGLAWMPVMAADTANKQYVDTKTENYYASTLGGGTVDTVTSAAANPCSLTLSAGTWDIDYRAEFDFSVSTDRYAGAFLSQGLSNLATTFISMPGYGGDMKATASSFVRVTLNAQTTLTIRTSTSATGGTQGNGPQAMRARRVA